MQRVAVGRSASLDSRDKPIHASNCVRMQKPERVGALGTCPRVTSSHDHPADARDNLAPPHKSFRARDKFENMGAQMVREVASKTSDQAGDGTTTATVLAHAIVREGAKAVAAGMNPMDLKRGVDLAVETIVADLQKNSKNVTSNEEIAQVGPANGDAEIGGFIADAMKKVGNEGVITVEEAKSLETELEVWSRACSSIAATSRPTSSPMPTTCGWTWRIRIS